MTGRTIALTSTTRQDVTGTDRLRQVTVTVSEGPCVLGTLYGVGVLGTREQDSSGGALSAEATRIAPAGPTFSIWTVIYLGLLAYTVWQCPTRCRDERPNPGHRLAGRGVDAPQRWLAPGDPG